MTRYTVVWHKSALANLAHLWNESFDRRAVASAADRIDMVLRVDAAAKGTLVSPQSRKLLIHPLAALFRVREDDRIVEVINIKLDTSTV
jgi:hypothetical protein